MKKEQLSLAPLLLCLGACSPTVKVESPDKPIDVNMNVNIKHKIKIQKEDKKTKKKSDKKSPAEPSSIEEVEQPAA